MTVPLTIQGPGTIERSTALGTPAFSLLNVGKGGDRTVSQINFRNGNAVAYGGAIYGEGGPVTVHGGTFTENHSGEYGGAIYNEDGLTVTGTAFTGNTAAYYGGAIYNDDPALVTRSTFTGNTAVEYGGALYDGYDTVALDDTFSDNSAPGDDGGAIYIGSKSTTTTTTTTTVGVGFFFRNSADSGGVIYADGDGLTVSHGYFKQKLGQQLRRGRLQRQQHGDAA